MSKHLHIKHLEIMGKHSKDRIWSEQVVNDKIHKGVWICGTPGTPPDPHIHPDFNEWWVVLDGKTRWQIGQYEAVIGEWGDLIMAPAGFSHDIRPWEGKQCIRLGVSKPGGNHDIKGIKPCRFIPVESDLNNPNLIHTKYKIIKNYYGTDKNWTHTAIEDERNTGKYIHMIKENEFDVSEENFFNAWFILLEGKVNCYHNSDNVITSANKGDLVYLPTKKTSRIVNVNNDSSIIMMINAKKPLSE